jgi:hypothetical protein
MAAWISGSCVISGGTWFSVRGVRLGAAVQVSEAYLWLQWSISPFWTDVDSTSFWLEGSFWAWASAVRLPTNLFLGCRSPLLAVLLSPMVMRLIWMNLNEEVGSKWNQVTWVGCDQLSAFSAFRLPPADRSSSSSFLPGYPPP